MDAEKLKESRSASRSQLLYSADDQYLLSGLGPGKPENEADHAGDGNGTKFQLNKYKGASKDFNYGNIPKKMSTYELKNNKYKKALNATDPLKRVNSMYSPKSVYEELQLVRRVKLPKALLSLHHVLQEFDDSGEDLSQLAQVSKYLPYISDNKLVKIEPQVLYTRSKSSATSVDSNEHYSPSHTISQDYYASFNKDPNYTTKMRIGLILSGGPAPGGHNVIAGVFDYLKSRNPESQLVGFIGGLDGLKYKRYHVISEEIMDQYRNLGGFNMLLSGRGMIASKMEFDMVVKTVTELELDGLIIVGGDGSNSNAANISNYLAHHYATMTTESFFKMKELESPLDTSTPNSTGNESSRSKSLMSMEKNVKRCVVVGVPKTVDGDIRSKNIEITFGFDTAARTYSELIGNLCTDAVSTQYNYHFVRIMGRSASHLALECALQTHPNMLLVSEEVSQKNISLQQIVDDIVDLIQKRYEIGKTFGVILIPEGLIEFVPDFKVLIQELNQAVGHTVGQEGTKKVKIEDGRIDFDVSLLDRSRKTWEFLPPNIQEQLLSDIESSGSIMVAKIATESLLSMLVVSRIESRGLKHLLEIDFMTHYFGYEGRCAIPSEFDSSYCYSLGYTAAVLIAQKKNGYMAAIRDLKNCIEDWVPLGIPFTNLMTLTQTPHPGLADLAEMLAKDKQNDNMTTVSSTHTKNLETDKTINLDKKVGCSIKKTLLDLESDLFKAFDQVREVWAYADLYRNPGPIQIVNSSNPSASSNLTEYLDSYKNMVAEADEGSNYSHTFRNGNNGTNGTNGSEEGEDVYEFNESRCYTLQTPTLKELVGDHPFKPTNRSLRVRDKSFMSDLEKTRLEVLPEIPIVCYDQKARMIPFKKQFDSDQYVKNQIMLNYPYQHRTNHFNQYELVPNNQPHPLGPMVREVRNSNDSSGSKDTLSASEHVRDDHHKPMRIGIVPVGKHAPGILNVFWGIYERTKKLGGTCFAFHGVRGLMEKSYIELEDEDFDCFKNQGGLELVLRSKRSFLHKQERIEMALNTCTSLDLDGLVMLGDEMSMTQASLVTEYFMSRNSKTCVVGVPVAGGNSLGGNLIEACVGFDTNARIYASLVGNVLTDAISMPKYWHFVKILGRYPSIEVLECALQTHPNVVIIAEEYRNSDKTLFDIVDEIANAVVKRSKLGKNFGTVLIPDHLVLHLPNTKNMLQDVGNVINTAQQMNKKKEAIEQLLNYSTFPTNGSHKEDSGDEFVKMITPWSLAVFASFPDYIRREILNLDFGEVTLESLQIEVMLSRMVKEELAVRQKRGEYSGNYAAVTHYFGYQGRCAMPSEFDCSLAFAYGHLAAICVETRLSGFCCSIRAVCGSVKDWKLFAAPFTCMMRIAPDSFKMLINPKSEVPIIPSKRVNLHGKAFRNLKSARKKWLIEDLFNNPGPIQFNAFVGTQNITLITEHSQYYHMITSVERFTEIIKNLCKFGVSEEYLHHAFIQLWGLIKITQDKNQLISLSEDFKLL
ncbi:pyrophosphate--fructose 6-phosphate 1-phosphotransferase subunit alpha [Theileria orientalis]|uniref:Probable ATP-dependent 6-phosphofructokinase n=1 Tax=Theileria orientalis TaxID=68886 RepID=A0A976M8M6_THEOR|nr:pyrophosphate--fructose 6-phosphate 1-phosphotransferase subunit alpha [Theileria orientalis]